MRAHFEQTMAGVTRLSLGMICAVALLTGGLLIAQPASAADPAVTKESPANLPGYNVYRPAKMKHRAMPVIAWGNGGCVRSDASWTNLYERWVREGYFVITITQPPGAAPLTMANAMAPGARYTADDQAAAINWAVKENATRGSPYYHRLDPRRIVAAGNSCGGITSLTLASRQINLKSVFVLSGSSIGPGQKVEASQAIMSKVTVPVMFIVGGEEDIARVPANMDYDQLPAGGAAMVVMRSSGDHRTVSTDAAIQRDAGEISVNWFKATLYNDRAARKTLATTLCAGCDLKIWTVKSKNMH
jgi:dienelactone hydrolase